MNIPLLCCYEQCARQEGAARYGTFREVTHNRPIPSSAPPKESDRQQSYSAYGHINICSYPRFSWKRECGGNGMSPLKLPLVFHVLLKFDQMKDGKELSMWLTSDDVRVITSEVNRIWQQANIEFEVKRINLYKENPTEEQSTALSVLENADREAEGENPELDELRKAAISTLSEEQGISDPSALNAFFVPYMGKTRQGNAVGGNTTICCGVWSDKHTRGRLIEKMLLVESADPVIRGSIGRTVAHELGHCLGLRHIRSPVPPLPSLMGSGPLGYNLQDVEIRQARRRALEIQGIFKA